MIDLWLQNAQLLFGAFVGDALAHRGDKSCLATIGLAASIIIQSSTRLTACLFVF